MAATKKKPRVQHQNPRRVHQKPPKRDSLAIPKLPSPIEEALFMGNLLSLSPEQRVNLVMATCKSLRLNPLTKPFDYIMVKDWEGEGEKLILYATKNCTDQLRQIHSVTVVPGTLKRWEQDGMLYAEVFVRDRTGRMDGDIGIIPLKRWRRGRPAKDGRPATPASEYTLTGAQLANAKMHVVTKAKRRATLSLCGLGGIPDELELDTMQVVGGITSQGRVYRRPLADSPQPLTLELPPIDQDPHVQDYLSKLSPEDRATEEAAIERDKAKTSAGTGKPVERAAAENLMTPSAAVPAKPEPEYEGLTYKKIGQTYRIDGPEELKKTVSELLRPWWDGGVRAIVIRQRDAKSAEEHLGKLISQLESRKMRIRAT
jgi:hypothetical protein